MTFLQELEEQRWDDHRYYHHNRVNQSLHFLSAICFLAAYALLFLREFAAAALLGWLGAMVLRQSGHFFFEPKGYDEVNQATHAHKEAIKVGYNLRRKVVLHALWIALPLALWLRPGLFGLLEPHVDFRGFVQHVAIAWLVLGVAAVVARTAWLCAFRGVQTGLVWCTKILTDPFHDLMLYRRAPLQLLRGEIYDPVSLRSGPHAGRR